MKTRIHVQREDYYRSAHALLNMLLSHSCKYLDIADPQFDEFSELLEQALEIVEGELPALVTHSSNDVQSPASAGG